MQADGNEGPVTAPLLDRIIAHQHVQGRFRGPIGVPAADLVVADRADARRKHREDGPPLPGHQWQKMLRHQSRPDGVHRKDPLKSGAALMTIALFRLQVLSVG